MIQINKQVMFMLGYIRLDLLDSTTTFPLACLPVSVGSAYEHEKCILAYVCTRRIHFLRFQVRLMIIELFGFLRHGKQILSHALSQYEKTCEIIPVHFPEPLYFTSTKQASLI